MQGVRQLGYGKPGARPGLAVPIEDLFSRRYDFDAFALAYTVPGQAWRYTKDSAPADLQYVLLFVDLDAHDLDGAALDGWKHEELERARALLKEHPGLLYPTKNGVRLAWRIEPTDLSTYQHIARHWYALLEALGFRGLDSTASSFGRHMRLPRVLRDGKVEDPVIEGSLEVLTWEAPPYAAKKNRPRSMRAAVEGPPKDPTIIHALAQGLAAPIGPGKWAVFCPNERHNEGMLTSATAVFDDGRFRCLKATCRHVGYDAWAASIGASAKPRAEAEPLIVGALKLGGVGWQAVVVDVPPGVGKSHIARSCLPVGGLHEGISSVLLSPTNALSTQHREASGAQQFAGIGADIPDRTVCKHPKAVAALNAAGVSSKFACASCPDRQGCTVAKGIGDPAFGIVATHALVHRFRD